MNNSDYEVYLTCESKRAAGLLDAFKENYCIRDIECTALSGVLKKQLNDPDSYESQKIYVSWVKEDKFEVTNEFRAKNVFGALVLNKCKAIIDSNGNVYDLKMEMERVSSSGFEFKVLGLIQHSEVWLSNHTDRRCSVFRAKRGSPTTN